MALRATNVAHKREQGTPKGVRLVLPHKFISIRSFWISRGVGPAYPNPHPKGGSEKPRQDDYIARQSVWGQEIYFFSIFFFNALFGMLLKDMGERFLLSKDEPLTPNIDGVMAL